MQFSVPSRYHLYGAALLHLYYSLSAGRQVGYSGPQAIAWTDLLAWKELNGYELRPHEVETLKAMDVAYVDTINRLKAERLKP